MSFLTALTGVESRATAINGLSLRDPAMAEWFGGRQTIAGANITPHTALRISGWYAGVRILAETIASLPMITYERLDRGKRRAVNHPVYPILHDAPNSYMTNMEFMECMQGWLLGWGNAFAEIQRDQRGRVIALWPFPPNAMRIQNFNGRLWYYARNPGQVGQEIQYRQEDILHVRGLSGDGVVGYGIVDMMRETLGLAKVEEEYRARFFSNNATPGGIIEYPGVMTAETHERFKKDWDQVHGGSANKFRVAFLEQGFKYHETMFTPQAAEFIEGRKFQLEEIARILGVPLILLQSTEKATSWGTGIEQFMLAFVQFTIRPWLKRWEARLNQSLFAENERRKYFAEALIEDLLRADSKTRAEVLQIWRRNGIINADDWLEMENRNPLPNGQGQIYIVESNMTTLDQVGQEPAAPDPEPAADAMRALDHRLETALAELRQQPPPSITINNPPVNVDIAPPSITIESREQPPAQITVNTPPVNVDIAPPSITIESREQPPAQITVNTPPVNVDIAPPSITIESREQPPAQITVNTPPVNVDIAPPAITVEGPEINPVHHHPPARRTAIEKVVTERDAQGLIVRVEEREIDAD